MYGDRGRFVRICREGLAAMKMKIASMCIWEKYEIRHKHIQKTKILIAFVHLCKANIGINKNTLVSLYIEKAATQTFIRMSYH